MDLNPATAGAAPNPELDFADVERTDVEYDSLQPLEKSDSFGFDPVMSNTGTDAQFDDFTSEDVEAEYAEYLPPSNEEFDGEGFSGNWALPNAAEYETQDEEPITVAEDILPYTHVSHMQITDPNQAREIAEYVINELEEDVYAYMADLHKDAGSADPQPLRFIKYSGGNISLKDEWSDLVLGQPSTMRLYYEEGRSEYRDLSLTHLRPEQMIDATVEAHLHRDQRQFGKGQQKFAHGFSQTKEMTFLSPEAAERQFRRMYPGRDGWRRGNKEDMPRRATMEKAINKAENEDPNVDKARIGPKVKWSTKARLLGPLPDDYYKAETFWTGSEFRGEFVKRQLHHGFFNYPLMSTYESEFKGGHIHSRKYMGLVTYPRGDIFEGQWRKGRHISGKITFSDDLVFEPRGWDYCAEDRRFYIERDLGVKHAGKTLYNNRLPNPYIPPGCYDVGDGIYYPNHQVVTTYNGEKLRDVTMSEQHWILENCRRVKNITDAYVPSFNVDRLPCTYTDNYVRQ